MIFSGREGGRKGWKEEEEGGREVVVLVEAIDSKRTRVNPGAHLPCS